MHSPSNITIGRIAVRDENARDFKDRHYIFDNKCVITFLESNFFAEIVKSGGKTHFSYKKQLPNQKIIMKIPKQ